MRLDVEGVHAFIRGGCGRSRHAIRPTARAGGGIGSRVCAKDEGRHGVPCRAWIVRAAARIEIARHISGFLPPAPRAENTRGAAKLIRAVPGVEFVEMPLADQCCGSAGVYNVTETKTSMELLAEKMRHAGSTKASVIVTANPGCILQLRAGAKLHDTKQEVMHVVELLDRATVHNA